MKKLRIIIPQQQKLKSKKGLVLCKGLRNKSQDSIKDLAQVKKAYKTLKLTKHTRTNNKEME